MTKDWARFIAPLHKKPTPASPGGLLAAGHNSLPASMLCRLWVRAGRVQLVGTHSGWLGPGANGKEGYP